MSFLAEVNGKIEFIGKVFIEQMYFESKEDWLLKRIPPICENCNNNNYFYFNKSYQVDFPFAVKEIYRINCPECGETFELEIDEYWMLEPFISINKKFEEGKISETEYKEQELRIIDRLKKKVFR